MSDLSAADRHWLDAAARYATSFLGTTADAPTSAALVVNPHDQVLLARAVAGKGGRPHAEAQAIAAAGFEAAGSTLYVTLEPCHHWGRTPPCVDAIIRGGIMRVVIGAGDPDPLVAGSSIAQLKSAGVETVLAQHGPSLSLHAGHILRHTADRPLVTAMVTVSQNDMIARKGEGRVVATGSTARRWIDIQRTRNNAVLVGAATARQDDPSLVVTLPGLTARTPLRVVLAGAGGAGRDINLVGGFSGYRTAVIAQTDAPVDAPVSVETIRVTGHDGRPDLDNALAALAGRGVQNLLVEPGQRLLAGLLEADLVDRLALLRTPMDVGEGGIPASPDGAIVDLLAAAGLIETGRQRLGDDVLVIYERPSAD